MMEGSFILRFVIDVRKYVRYNKKKDLILRQRSDTDDDDDSNEFAEKYL